MRDLEKKEERKERKKRKHNIVIKGVRWRGDDVKQEAKDFIQNEMKVEVNVTKATKMKLKGEEEMVVVRIGSWEEKCMMMSQKKKTLKQAIYINDDLIKEERVIQKKLRERERKATKRK